MPDPHVIVCPTCGGSGTVYVKRRGGTEERDCPQCDGSGRVIG